MNTNHKKFYIIIYIVLGMVFSLARTSYAWTCQVIYDVNGTPHAVQTEKNSDGDGKLDVSGSGFFSKETSEMRALRKLYQNAEGSLYAKKGYVLFVVGRANASGEPDESLAVQGDMPRGKQFGYLFTSAVEDVGRLAAHELGHGIFTLRHTFDVNLLGTDSKGQTSNLLDYGTGTELAVWQWNVMANPAPLELLFHTIVLRRKDAFWPIYIIAGGTQICVFLKVIDCRLRSYFNIKIS